MRGAKEACSRPHTPPAWGKPHLGDMMHIYFRNTKKHARMDLSRALEDQACKQNKVKNVKE